MTQEGKVGFHDLWAKHPLFSFSIQEGFNIQAGSYEKAHKHTLIKCLNSEYWVMSFFSAVAKVIDQKLFTENSELKHPQTICYFLIIYACCAVLCRAVSLIAFLVVKSY
jgi:hypothetical protein